MSYMLYLLQIFLPLSFLLLELLRRTWRSTESLGVFLRYAKQALSKRIEWAKFTQEYFLKRYAVK